MELQTHGGVPERTWIEGEAFARLSDIGIVAICELITTGMCVQAMAETVGVSKNALWRWLNADIDRSTRARAARALTAWHWDEEAEAVLQDASDVLELARARELAAHYRWRAAKVAPREFGDKVETTQEVGNNLAARLSAAQWRLEIAELAAKLDVPGIEHWAQRGADSPPEFGDIPT